MAPTRREFVQSVALAAAAASLTPAWGEERVSRPVTQPSTRPATLPTADRLPRWRGFNLLEKFVAEHSGPFKEEDFDLIAEWGFDFVRLPLSYQCWAKPASWLEIDEKPLKDIDQAVDWGRKRGIHVNINFHRAPGYCVNPPKEPLSIWDDEKALDAAAFHWGTFAHRYRGIPSSAVSFDLLNEPADIPEKKYTQVVTRLVEAIRAEDPQRLIVADGLNYGRKPVESLLPLHIAQSTRGYNPMRISHWRANWMPGSDTWPEPTWPLNPGAADAFDKDRLRRENIAPWKKLEAKGSGVHVGEWGAFHATPHRVVLAWMADCVDLWREAGWGWSLWNFRGAFGLLDSGRKDVAYEKLKTHQLDRKMLDVLRAG